MLKIFLLYRSADIEKRILRLMGLNLKSDTVGYLALSTVSNPIILSTIAGVNQGVSGFLRRSKFCHSGFSQSSSSTGNLNPDFFTCSYISEPSVGTGEYT